MATSQSIEGRFQALPLLMSERIKQLRDRAAEISCLTSAVNIAAGQIDTSDLGICLDGIRTLSETLYSSIDELCADGDRRATR